MNPFAKLGCGIGPPLANTCCVSFRSRIAAKIGTCPARPNLLPASGQLCFGSDGKLVATGQLGAGVSIENGQQAARACAISLITQVKAALGDLDKVKQVVRLGGFINSAPGFTDGPKVMNGASDLMVAVFGDQGKHARSTVGVAALPADAAVEVEGTFEVS